MCANLTYNFEPSTMFYIFRIHGIFVISIFMHITTAKPSINLSAIIISITYKVLGFI